MYLVLQVPSKHSYQYIPNISILMPCLFDFKDALKFHSNFLTNVSFEVDCLFSKYFQILQLSVFDFLFLVTLEHSLYPFCNFTHVKMCFKVQNVVYFGKCSMSAWEECAFCHWIKYSRNVKLIKLIDSAVQVIYIFTDLLSYWSIMDRSILMSLTLILDLSFFPFSSIIFLPPALWCSFLRCTC